MSYRSNKMNITMWHSKRRFGVSVKVAGRYFMRKQMKTSSERVWKQIRVSLLFVRKKTFRCLTFYDNGLVGRWRESLGDRQICSVSIQRADKGEREGCKIFSVA